MSDSNSIAVLKDKAKNFKAFLLKYRPTKVVLDRLETYNEDNIVDEMSSTLVPIILVGGIDFMVEEFMKELTIPAGEVPAVRNRIIRYLKLFYELLG